MKTIILFLSLCISIVNSETLKIASYNVENLFDMEKSGYEYDSYVPNHHNWTKQILNKKLNHIAEVICDLNADVIGLQEIENEHILSRLQKLLARVGCVYKYKAITNSKKTPIHNALLSKVPIKKKRDITIYRNSRHRSILEVELKTTVPLLIFVNHWKSKQGPESHRIVYAKALMQRIDKLSKNKEYIILGDFNSDYDEYKKILKKHNDTSGKTGINHVLKTIENDKLIRMNALTQGYHYNLWLELGRHTRWSHNFFGDKQGLDAIIIPYSLRNAKKWEYKNGSFAVFNPKYLFGRHGAIKRWEYKHHKHTGRGYSDHLPIYAEFTLDSLEDSSSFINKISRLFVSDNPKKKSEKIYKHKMQDFSISDIIKDEDIKYPIILKDAKVIFKRVNSAIIKQDVDGRAILLYKCADSLVVGGVYDIQVYKKKKYKGLSELVDISSDLHGKIQDIDKYIHEFDNKMMNKKIYSNEMVKNITGIYKNRMLEKDGKKFPIYFKKRAKRPPNGSSIRIKIAQIGYYKNHNELVVWSRKDYKIME